MAITASVTQNVIKKLLMGEDYRIEVVALINADFLQFAIDFFKQIVEGKLANENIDVDWYKKKFLDPGLSSKEIAVNSGLNKKTIHNMFNSSTREIVIDAADKHYDSLCEAIKNLVDNEPDLDLRLTIKFKDVSVDLNLNESLMVTNTLAVKRAALRGGLWSAVGKRVEKPLMQTLCGLYEVSKNNYSLTPQNDVEREGDFYLIEGENQYKCEVKLMGSGNPESADAVYARESQVFVADKLSDANKNQLNSAGVKWVELRNDNGFRKFAPVLESLGISHKELPEDIDKKLEEIFEEIFR